MSKLLEIGYVLDSNEMTAITGLEPYKIIGLINQHEIYKYRMVTPALIPVSQKDNSFWYDKNLVDHFLFKDHIDYEVYLPDKSAPLLIRDLKRQLTFLIAPEGGN